MQKPKFHRKPQNSKKQKKQNEDSLQKSSILVSNRKLNFQAKVLNLVICQQKSLKYDQLVSLIFTNEKYDEGKQCRINSKFEQQHPNIVKDIFFDYSPSDKFESPIRNFIVQESPILLEEQEYLMENEKATAKSIRTNITNEDNYQFFEMKESECKVSDYLRYQSDSKFYFQILYNKPYNILFKYQPKSSQSIIQKYFSLSARKLFSKLKHFLKSNSFKIIQFFQSLYKNGQRFQIRSFFLQNGIKYKTDEILQFEKCMIAIYNKPKFDQIFQNLMFEKRQNKQINIYCEIDQFLITLIQMESNFWVIVGVVVNWLKEEKQKKEVKYLRTFIAKIEQFLSQLI